MSERDKFQPPRAVVRPELGRRRVLMGGLASAPVLMTLVSRPVLGQVCVTPSAFVSGNASVAGVAVVCEGYTPDYWVDAPSWPQPFTPDTPFNDAFGPNPDYACQTLLDVLSPPAIELPAPAPPEQPAPPPPSNGRRYHQYRVPSPTSRGRPSHGAGLSPGAFTPVSQKTLEIGTSGRQKLRLGPSEQAAPGSHSRQHPNRHGQGQGTDEGTGQVTVPAAPDPAPVGSLGCNDNTASAPSPAASSPDPSSPAPSDSRRRKHHSSRGASRAPTQQDVVARHIVAALLNAQAGLTPAVSVKTVKGIWNEYVTKGYFEPTAGVQWSREDILTYLASTQPL